MVYAYRSYNDGNLQFFGNVQSVELDNECTGLDCTTEEGAILSNDLFTSRLLELKMHNKKNPLLFQASPSQMLSTEARRLLLLLAMALAGRSAPS